MRKHATEHIPNVVQREGRKTAVLVEDLNSMSSILLRYKFQEFLTTNSFSSIPNYLRINGSEAMDEVEPPWKHIHLLRTSS